MSVHATEKYAEIKALLGIPEDEPIFILRAQDQTAVRTLQGYLSLNEVPGNDPSWMHNVVKVRDEFQDWAIKNSTKVKRAD